MKKFPILLVLVSSAYGIVIECQFNINVTWDKADRRYLCEKYSVSGNEPNLVNVTGQHIESLQNVDVEALSVISENELVRIPRGIDKFFPNLVVFRWMDGNLKVLDDLKQFPNLVLLVLTKNKLVSLDVDVFQHTLKLQAIYLYDNLIAHVGLDLLTNLNELTSVYFVRNPCLTFSAYSAETLQELKELLPIRCPPMGLTNSSTTISSTLPTTVSSTLPTTISSAVATTISSTLPTTIFSAVPTTLPLTVESESMTESVECSARCSINDETDELKRQIFEHYEDLAKMRGRIFELEKQMRELNYILYYI